MNIVAQHVNHPLGEADFDAEAWQGCQPIEINHYWSGEPAPPARHAEVRICWSDAALHVRFVGAQKEPLITAENPRIDQKTLGLWDRDVCEIFLAPDLSNPARYFEFAAAPTGEWIDLGIVGTPTGKESDCEACGGRSLACEPVSLRWTRSA